MKSTHKRNVEAMQAAPRCHSNTKAGLPCKKPAMRGSPLCKSHAYEPIRLVPRTEHEGHRRRAYAEQQQAIRGLARELEQLIRKVKDNELPDWLTDRLAALRGSLVARGNRDASPIITPARKVAPPQSAARSAGTPPSTASAMPTQGDTKTPAQLAAEQTRNRAIGAILGLAVGDAIGVTTAGLDRGTFRERLGMHGRGLLDLEPGEWSWDTAMMLVLGDNLIDHREFDPRTYLEQLVDHRDIGNYSPSKKLNPGSMTALALNRFEQFDELVAVEQAGIRPQNGCLARMAPVAVRYWRQPSTMLEVAVQQARTTHSGTGVEELSRAFVELVAGAIEGRSKSDLLTNCSRQEPWGRTVTFGELRQISNSRIDSGHEARTAFQAALWCVGTSDGFRNAVLKARELGGDATSIGAMAGQLAGAIYGANSIPCDWLEDLAGHERIEKMAVELFEAGRA
jgi:ADP-ribosyl-[dinitrogen reductase] hydrolase